MNTRRVLAISTPILATTMLIGVDSTLDLRAQESSCPGAGKASPDVLLCEDFEDVTSLTQWDIGSSRNTWPVAQFALCTGGRFGFQDRCAAWSNHLVFDGQFGFWGYDARRQFRAQNEFYVRWYQQISDPYRWGSLEDKSLILHDPAETLTAYVATNRNEGAAVANSGPGMPFVANYQDVDWSETGGRYTAVNRFQNLGRNITLEAGKWYLFEWHVKLNRPGASDGVTRLWIDDASRPIVHQTLRMEHTDMRWLRTSDAGRQFSTLRLTVYHQRCDGSPNTCPPNGPAVLEQSHRWDHVVISKAPVGPLEGLRGSPPAPANPRIIR